MRPEQSSILKKYGLSVIMIEATDYLPSFVYSIGPWEKFKHPEIVSIGLTTKTLHGIINNAADLVKGGEIISEGAI